LFAEPDISHWALPQATAIVDEAPNDQIIKGTYVRDLNGSQAKDSMQECSHHNVSFESISDDSSDSRPASFGPCKKKLEYNSDDDCKMPASPSIQQHRKQRSFSSQMESTGSSFKDEASEVESLAYSLPSFAGQSFLSPTPLPSDVESKQSFKASGLSSSRKAPPPSAYRLSARQSSNKASPFADYFKRQDEEYFTPKRSNLKPPPPGSLNRAPQPKFEEVSDEEDDMQEEFTNNSMEGSEVTGHDFYFTKVDSYSQSSRPSVI
jgi:hypothetical protein